MKFEDHCKESIILFGRPFEYVHLWLDEFAGKKPFGMKHRRIRHHMAGIKEIEKMWDLMRQRPQSSILFQT